MEVHAHTHTARKKWTHYFWEFLMLFLAISAGFFVENLREHYIENKRVKVLAASLLTDLRKDTAQLNFLENSRMKREMNLDSFIILLHKPSNQIERASFYRLIKRIFGIYTFSPSRGTIDQLKNAGYLRYFSDNQLIQHISDYEFMIQDYKFDENIGVKWYDIFIETTINNLDHDIIDTMMQRNSYPVGTGIDQLTSGISKNLTANVVIQRANNKIMRNQNERLKKKAVEIIAYLHSKYYLK